MPKGSDQLNVAIGYELKNDFRKWCMAHNTSATEVITILAKHLAYGEPLNLPNQPIYPIQDNLELESRISKLEELLENRLKETIAEVVAQEVEIQISKK